MERSSPTSVTEKVWPTVSACGSVAMRTSGVAPAASPPLVASIVKLASRLTSSSVAPSLAAT